MKNDNLNKGGRPTKVVIEKAGKTWSIRFSKNGKRVRKSCKTKIESEAVGLAKQIEWLLVNPKCSVTSKAYELFFGELPKIPSTENEIETIKDFKDDENKTFVIQSLMREVSALKQQLEIALPFEVMYKQISKTREGQILIAAETLPTVKEALKEYYMLIQHLAHPHRTKSYLTAFFEGNGIDKKLDEATPSEIHKYLTDTCQTKYQWHKKRQYFTQYYNRINKLYAFENPMSSVMDKKPEHKADIHYHTVEEVNKFLKTLKTDYDKALFSTLFFTGVNASEFRGLKLTDYFEIDGQWVIRVSPNDCRSIKRAKRRRNINVGSRLKKALDTYLKGHKGGEALFNPLIGSGSHWKKRTFSKYTAERFNADMNCLSTRRTFGSLLIRQGVSGTRVAAAMGNSLQMVDKHYGRIKSQEVKALDI